MFLRSKGRVAFLGLLCLALCGAGGTDSRIRNRAAPSDRLDLRGSLFPSGFSVRHSTPDSIVISLSVDELTIQPTTTRRGLQHDIRLAHGEPLGRVGAPDLPVYRKLVAVPDGGDVVVRARTLARTAIARVDVPAFKADEIPSQERRESRHRGMIPTESATVEYVGYLRGQRLASLLISPARYDQARRELDVTTDMELVVTVANATGDVLKNMGPFQGVMKGTVLNAGEGISSAPPGALGGARRRATLSGGQVCWCSGSSWQDAAASAISCGADYLMIVSDSLVASTMVDTLALRRANYNGFNVAIVQMSQIDAAPDTSSTPVSIRALIDSVYASQSAGHIGDGRLGYVLLFGDAYDPNRTVLIPSYYGYADPAQAKADDLKRASDAYYSFLDADPPVDRFPDVLVGRLPVDRDDTNWEITNVVHKIISYEPLSGDAWTDSILMVSGASSQGFTFQGLGGFQSFFDSVLTYYGPPGKTAIQQHRLALGAPQDTTKHRIFGNKIRASMGRGKWVTAFFDHGSPFYWVGAFYPRSYEFLADTGKPSIVFSIGSNTTQFDLTADWALNVMGSCSIGNGCTVHPPSSISCESPGYMVVDPCDVLAERILVQEGGAVAVIGYSRSQIATNAQADFTNLFRSLSEQNPSTLGELLVGARMFQIHNDVTARNLMLLGDPALDIRTRALAAQDTVDLAVGIHDMRLVGEPDGDMTYYVDANGTLGFSAIVRNPWRTNAVDVDVECWQGEPDAPGSTMLASTTLDIVPAYGSETITFDVADPSGNFEVFVVVDPHDGIVERNEDNNTASRQFLGLRYEGDYPVRVGFAAQRPITVADVTSDAGKEYLLSGYGEIRCYAVGDTSYKWSNLTSAENELFLNIPVVGHFYKSSPTFVALEAKAASSSSALRILQGETGAVVATHTLNQNSFGGIDAGLVKWMLTDLGPDDAAMDLVTLVYRDNAFVDSLLVRAQSPSGTVLFSVLVDEIVSLRPATMAVADIDANGSKEIVVLVGLASSSYELNVFSYGPNGCSLLWRKDVANGGTIAEPAVLLFDRGRDGDVEILCSGAWPGPILRLYNAAGTPVWGSDVTANGPPKFAAGDIDGDGQAEVVIADNGRVRMLSAATGQVLYSRTTMNGTAVSGPYLVDLDADGKLDVVVLYETQNTYFYPPQDNTYLYTLDESLDVLEPTRVFSRQSGSHTVVPPAIDDLDDDGRYEMIYVSTDNVLHVFEIGSAAGDAAWSQRFANAMLTGLNEQPIIGDGYTNPVSLYQRTRMLGDVVLDSIAAPSLYIGHGTEVRVDASTQDPYQIRAFGSVRMKGSAAAPVVLGTQPPASGVATWGGLYVDDRFASAGDPDTLSFVELSDASVGIEAHSAFIIASNTISNVFNAGIVATDTVWVNGSDVVASSDVGIEVRTGGFGRINDSHVDGGALVGVSAAEGALLRIRGSTISNAVQAGVLAGDVLWFDQSRVSTSSGLGIKLTSDALGRISRSVISNTDSTAILCDSCAHASVIDSTTIRSAGGHGLLVIGNETWEGTAGITVDSCTVADNAFSGVYLDHAHGVVSRCRIDDNGSGVTRVGSGTDVLTIENSEITGGAIGIEHDAPVRVSNSSVSTVSNAGVIAGDTLWFENSSVNASLGFGIHLTAGAGQITGSTVQNTGSTGVSGEQGVPLIITNSTITNVSVAAVIAADSLWFEQNEVSSSSGLGIRLANGAIGRIRHALIQNTDSVGVLCDSCSYYTTIDSTTIRLAGDHGVSVIGSASWEGSDGISVDSCTVADNAGSGIHFDHAHGTVSRCRIDDNSSGVTRVGSGTDVLTIENSEITGGAIGIEHDAPVRVSSSSVSSVSNAGVIAGDTLWFENSEVNASSDEGIHLGAGALGRVTNSLIQSTGSTGIFCDSCATGTTIVGTTIDSAGLHGVHAIWVSDVVIDSCVVTNSTSAGVRFESVNGAIRRSYLGGNVVAITCFDSSDPVVQGCKINGNASGVSAIYDSFPMLGFGTGGGSNCIQNSTGYHVANLSDPYTPIHAQRDYWGAHCCQSSKFFGNVDCDSCASQSACSGAASPPSMVVILGEEQELAAPDTKLPRALDLIGVAPNPFNPSVRIRFAVPAGAEPVKIVVYNVLGQRVAMIEDRRIPAGYHETVWSGVTSRGAPAASGVYFVQMTSGMFRKTLKVVLLK